MKVLVVAKQTFDTEEPITVRDGRIVQDDVTLVLNPYDEYAVEQAVQLKEELGADVTVVTVGSDSSEQMLRTVLAMGADEAVMIEDESLATDEYALSQILAAFARQVGYDLILAGQMSIDNGSAQTGPRLAEELGIPFVTSILKFHLHGEQVTVERDMEGYTETLTVCLPALFTTQQGLNEPRYPTLPNVMKAKKKPIQRITTADIGLASESVSNKTKTVAYFTTPKKTAGRILAGSLDEQARELATLLRTAVRLESGA